MASLKEYFEKNRYQPKYEFGTRVFGRWNKIPFIGTVYGDSVVSDEQGPKLTIHLDLPLQYNNTVKTIIVDTHKMFKDLKPLTETK